MTEKCPPTALWPGSFPRVPFPGLPLPHLCAVPLRYHQIADFLGQILPKARLFGRSCPQMYGLSWSCEKVSNIFYAGSPLPTRCPDVIRPSIYERFTPPKPQASLYLTITAWIFMTEGLLWQDHGPLSSQTWNHQMARPQWKCPRENEDGDDVWWTQNWTTNLFQRDQGEIFWK